MIHEHILAGGQCEDCNAWYDYETKTWIESPDRERNLAVSEERHRIARVIRKKYPWLSWLAWEIDHDHWYGRGAWSTVCKTVRWILNRT